MVKHIVMWNFKEELSADERQAAYEKIKAGLLEVKSQAQGVEELTLIFNRLASSNKDLALISAFTSVEALNAYQTHPAHVKVAEYIKTVVCDRACLDYEG